MSHTMHTCPVSRGVKTIACYDTYLDSKELWPTSEPVDTEVLQPGTQHAWAPRDC
jgi:hypothetical protein